MGKERTGRCVLCGIYLVAAGSACLTHLPLVKQERGYGRTGTVEKGTPDER